MYEVQHLPAHGQQRVLDSARHVGTVVFVLQADTPCEHARTLSLSGSMNVLEGCTTELYADGIICRFFTAGALMGRRFGSDEDVCVAVM
jgi:hypothetical protein